MSQIKKNKMLFQGARSSMQPISHIIQNPKTLKTRLVIGIPTTGVIRYEWAIARWGQITPVNWSLAEIAQAYSTVGPIGYLVADARNVVAHTFIHQKECEWLLFIDHDVILPGDTFVKMNTYMDKGKIPLLSGLYYAKGNPPPPLVFRGRGNSVFTDWKMGDKVWVDAVVMGCTLIHKTLIVESAKISRDYHVPGIKGTIKQIFETPRKAWYDPESARYQKETGTEDIFFCDKLLKHKILKKAGWHKLAKKKYPFLCDTSIFCKHIDLQTGKQFP